MTRLFRNMELSTWLYPLKPKVEATWNLHELFPAEMDFFVMLSSMAAILGVASQAELQRRRYISGRLYQF